MATLPNFISTDVAVIEADMVLFYNNYTGRTLQPTDPEVLVIKDLAYRESLLRIAIQTIMEQMLIDFAVGINLDNLVALLNVTRLAETPASVTLEFTLVFGHTGVTVPAGTRVRSVDGKATFFTTSAVSAPVGVYTVLVDAECTVAGTVGNGYLAGDVNDILDPQPFIVSVVNTVSSAGGADTETDDQLRERAKLASATFSVAGPTEAYKYFALTANPGIIDVSVLELNPGDGRVYIYPLMADGNPTPQQILDDVLAICSAEDVRPLNDLPIVQSPTQLPYTANIELTLLLGSVGSDVLAAVQPAVDKWVLAKRQKLGQDIVDTQLIAVIQAASASVYSVALPGWTNIVVGQSEYGFCNNVNITIVNYVAA